MKGPRVRYVALFLVVIFLVSVTFIHRGNDSEPSRPLTVTILSQDSVTIPDSNTQTLAEPNSVNSLHHELKPTKTLKGPNSDTKSNTPKSPTSSDANSETPTTTNSPSKEGAPNIDGMFAARSFSSKDPELTALMDTFPDCKVHCTSAQWLSSEALNKEVDFAPLSLSSYLKTKQTNGPKWPMNTKCSKDQGDTFPKSSQVGQDDFVINYYNFTCGRTFIELGAADGLELSNTIFLERAYGWRGVCIEATPSLYDALVKNRPDCTNIHAVIANVPPEKERIVKYLTTAWVGLDGIWDSWSVYQKKNIVELMKVRQNPKCAIHCMPAVRLQTVLSQLELRHIDYFSLDVEGLEEEVLKTINWSKTTVELFTIEDGNEWGTPNAREFLINNFGYSKIQDLKWDSVVAKKF